LKGVSTGRASGILAVEVITKKVSKERRNITHGGHISRPRIFFIFILAILLFFI
jgi:hypothetical protein